MKRFRIAEVIKVPAYTPQDLWQAYSFPTNFDGSGIVIGLLEFGSGFAQADIDAFCRRTSLPPCTPAIESVDGGRNDGGGHPDDMEGTLDVEWAHAAAPGAKIVYFLAPPASNYGEFGQQMSDALARVVTYKEHVDILSISYGDAEASFAASRVRDWEAKISTLLHQNTLTFVASGDQGDYGTHNPWERRIRRTDSPATCPSAFAVGGTTLITSPLQETVWGDATGQGATGGGFSGLFARPQYQQAVQSRPMRGEPDLSAVADPTTGYLVVFEGQQGVVGGTSASCPLVAGLFARIAQARKANHLPPLGDIHGELYAHPECFRDITSGSNSYQGVVGYAAGPGWDPASGLGAPLGTKLLSLLVPGKAFDAATSSDKPASILVDGKQVTRDYIRGGVTWAPLRPVIEAMGGTIRSASTPQGEEIRIASKAGPVPTAAEFAVDSASPITAARIDQLARWSKRHLAIWARYLGGGGGAATPLSTQEVMFAQAQGLSLALVYNDVQRLHLGTSQEGATAAKEALAQAGALGVPQAVTIYADIERGWPLTSEWLVGWIEGVTAGGRYAGAYLSIADPAVQSVLRALRSSDARLASQLSLWAAHWLQPGEWTARDSDGAISLPPWGPPAPAADAAQIGIWQFAGNQCNGIVDLDLVHLSGSPRPTFWSPGKGG